MGLSLKHLGNALTGGLTGGLNHMFNNSGITGGQFGANFYDPLDLSGTTARQYQAQEAQKDREWQEYMSNTAHQREVADLEKAGLNPVLSATGGNGASTPGGAQAGQATGSGIGDLVGLLNAFSQIRANKTTAKQVESQEKLNDKTIENLADEIRQRGIRTAQDVKESDARIIKLLEEGRAKAQSNKINEDLGISDNDTGTTRTGAWAIKGERDAGKNIGQRMALENERLINQELSAKNEEKNREIAKSLERYLKPHEMEIFIKAQKAQNLHYQKLMVDRAKARGWK